MHVLVIDSVDDENTDNELTTATPNCSTTGSTTQGMLPNHPSLAAIGRQISGVPMKQYLNTITIVTTEAILDTDTTSMFIMEGPPAVKL